MTTTVNIQISDNAVKWIVVGAVALGALWLVHELYKDQNLQLPDEAEAFSKLPELQPKGLDDIKYAPTIKKEVEPLFAVNQGGEAVFKAAKCLFDLIRSRSGVQDADATQLIDKAFAKDGPLQFSGVTEPHIKNIGSGLVDGLRFIAKYCRRIPAHSNQEIPHQAALIQVNLICWFADQIEQHTIVNHTSISVEVA